MGWGLAMSSIEQIYSVWNVSAPVAAIGNVLIEEFSISDDSAALYNLRAGRYTTIRPGVFKRLMIGSDVVMSNTFMEKRTNADFVARAKGKVLINGLGLGMVIEQLLNKPSVTHITVIESNPFVIELVGPVFSGNDRVTIVQSCAFEYKPPRGSRYDFVWHDIWTEITGENLPQMEILHKKYRNRTGWQGSWAKDLCKLVNKGYRI
jgi:hypothetical protein